MSTPYSCILVKRAWKLNIKHKKIYQLKIHFRKVISSKLQALILKYTISIHNDILTQFLPFQLNFYRLKQKGIHKDIYEFKYEKISHNERWLHISEVLYMGATFLHLKFWIFFHKVLAVFSGTFTINIITLIRIISFIITSKKPLDFIPSELGTFTD